MHGMGWTRIRGIALTTTIALALAGCGQKAAEKRARAHQPQRAAGRIVVLPDSAIVVQAGSTEDQLARNLASDLPAPRTFRFTGVEFASWDARPTAPTLRTMYATVQILRAYPHVEVKLIGYTDGDGEIEDNRKLAQARVDRVQAMLVNGGIQARRITTEARPKADYIAPNDSEASRARNRRVELVVTAK